MHGLDVVADEASYAVENGGKFTVSEMLGKLAQAIKTNLKSGRKESYENRVGSSIKS